MTDDLPAADQTAVKKREIQKKEKKKEKKEKERSSLMPDITRDIYCPRWLATELKTSQEGTEGVYYSSGSNNN